MLSCGPLAPTIKRLRTGPIAELESYKQKFGRGVTSDPQPVQQVGWQLILHIGLLRYDSFSLEDHQT